MQYKSLWFIPVVHEEEGVVTARGRCGEGRLKPDMLANAILKASSPLPCVHLPFAPLHAPLPLLLVPLPAPSVGVAAAVVHDALPMLQIVLPSSCSSGSVIVQTDHGVQADNQ